MPEVRESLDEMAFRSIANQYFGGLESHSIIAFSSTKTLSILRTL